MLGAVDGGEILRQAFLAQDGAGVDVRLGGGDDEAAPGAAQSVEGIGDAGIDLGVVHGGWARAAGAGVVFAIELERLFDAAKRLNAINLSSSSHLLLVMLPAPAVRN